MECIRNRRPTTAALRLPAATHEDIGVTALTSHVIPTASMAPITDDPSNKSNLGGADPAFPPFVEHGSLAGGSAASAQYHSNLTDANEAARITDKYTIGMYPLEIQSRTFAAAKDDAANRQ